MKTVEIAYRYDGAEAAMRARPDDADAARARLNDGNRAFAELFTHLDEGSGTSRKVIPIDPRDLGLLRAGDALQQRPFAAVLGCSDARVPIELIFNEGPNDLFVVRVAGNALGEDVRGSLNYAIDHLGESLKLIVVLGHSACGAVTAAVDVFLDPAGYLALASKHAIRSIVDRLLFIVDASAKKMAATFGADDLAPPQLPRGTGRGGGGVERGAGRSRAAARDREARCPWRTLRLWRLRADGAHRVGAAPRDGRSDGPRGPA